MRARRTDANHRHIADALRKLGWSVISTHALGGFVDLVAHHPARGIRLVEVKTPKGKLTKAQEQLRADGWPVVIVRNVEDAAALR